MQGPAGHGTAGAVPAAPGAAASPAASPCPLRDSQRGTGAGGAGGTPAQPPRGPCRKNGAGPARKRRINTRRARPRRMGRLSRSKREKGRAPADGRGGPSSNAAGLPLVEVAEAILGSMQREGGKGTQSDMGSPEGSLLSAKWVETRISYDGRRFRVSIPMITLRAAAHEFQLGYIYGTLVQKVRPHVQECPGCGKLHEPAYRFSKGRLYEVGKGEAGRC